MAAPAKRRSAPRPAAETLRLSLESDLLCYPLWQEQLLAGMRIRPWSALWLAPLLILWPAQARRIVQRWAPPALDPWGLPARADTLAYAQQKTRDGAAIRVAGSVEIADALIDRFPLLGGTTEVAATPLPFRAARTRLADVVRLLRPHQWTKNALLFLPLILAHRWDATLQWVDGFVAFAAYSLCASAVYVFNDLSDVHRDRRHPEKARRAIASGTVPLRLAFLLVPLLAGASFAVAFTSLSPKFSWLLVGYFAASAWYNLRLSRIPILDVFALSSFYMLRLLAGGEATNTPLSFWMLVFSLFFFLSVGFLKRYVELTKHTSREGRAGYRDADSALFANIGVSCGVMSTFVLALYVNTFDVVRIYAKPEYLWALCPLLLYWNSRAWFLASRGTFSFDPVTFALRDRSTWMVAFGCLVSFALASGAWI